MRIIVIEDEIKTAKELEKMLTNLDSSITVEALIPSVAAGVSWLNNNPAPDLIFSDIQLGDGLSFEIFRQVQLEVPVIFCTAFDQYAIKAFESNSMDYLLKPVGEDALARSLDKFIRFRKHLIGHSSNLTTLAGLMNEIYPTYKKNLLVHLGDKILPVKISDIRFVYASGGAVHLYLNNGKHHPIQYTTEQLESLFNPEEFFRVNRQFIVNRAAIQNVEYYFNRRLHIVTDVTPPEKILIGKLKVQQFLKWIEQ